MHAAMDVRVIDALLLRDCVLHGRGRLTRRRVVEVGKRLAVHELLQRREVLAQRREIPLEMRNVTFGCGHRHRSVNTASRAVTCASVLARRSASTTCSTIVAAN